MTENLKKKLEGLLRCPVDWANVTGITEYPSDWLLFDWYRCLMDTAVSADEQVAISNMADFGELLIGEAQRPVIINIEAHMGHTKELYAARSERLSRLTFLSPSHDGKHFKPNLSRDLAIDRSRGAASLFFVDHTPEEMKSAFCSWFYEYFGLCMRFCDFYPRDKDAYGYSERTFETWRRFEECSQFRIAFNTRTQIGGVNGEVSRHICFDIALDARRLHAYPVSREEAEQIMHEKFVLEVEVLY